MFNKWFKYNNNDDVFLIDKKYYTLCENVKDGHKFFMTIHRYRNGIYPYESEYSFNTDYGKILYYYEIPNPDTVLRLLKIKNILIDESKVD